MVYNLDYLLAVFNKRKMPQSVDSVHNTSPNTFAISGILPLNATIHIKDEPLKFEEYSPTDDHNLGCSKGSPTKEINIKDEPETFQGINIKDESPNFEEDSATRDDHSFSYFEASSSKVFNPEDSAIQTEPLMYEPQNMSENLIEALAPPNNPRRLFRIRTRGSYDIPIPDQIYKCSLCPYETKVKRNLKTHLIIHTEEKPYKCQYCSFSTKHRSSLLIHNRTHTGDKPFKCHFCPFSAIQSTSLRTHLRIHTGERPYKCDLCSFTATQSFHLKTHLRIHTGEKPFQCTVCDYRTSEKSALNKHIKIHLRKSQ